MLRMDFQDSWADKREIIEEKTKFPSVRERLDFFLFHKYAVPNITGNWASGRIQVSNKEI